MPEKFRPLYERMSEEVKDISSRQADDGLEKTRESPEKLAEELYALWRDYRRLQSETTRSEKDLSQEKTDELQKSRSEKNSEQLEKLRSAIAERWHNAEVQEIFKTNMDRSLQEEAQVKPERQNYRQLSAERDAMTLRRDEMYRQMFSHRQEDPDELTQIELAQTMSGLEDRDKRLQALEAENPMLAAELSFERLKKYHSQLIESGFIWTPSREKYFNDILERLVILDQNRPVLLYGETGTGKTRLARALAKRLTDHSAYEVGEEAKNDIRPLLGSRSIDSEGQFITYGALGQALSGKKNSRQKDAGHGGLFFMDEMGGYPPDALRSLVKQISGRKPGEKISFAAWAGQEEAITPEFGFMGSTNLPSEKHPDRQNLPVEVARELTSLEIDYPPQSSKDPELYEMMLAAVMDKNGRVRMPKKDIGPAWDEKVSSDGKTKDFNVDESPASGGTLWRFANFVRQIQESYKGKDNVLTPTKSDASYLRQASLILAWFCLGSQSIASQSAGKILIYKHFSAKSLMLGAAKKYILKKTANCLKNFKKNSISIYPIKRQNINYLFYRRAK